VGHVYGHHVRVSAVLRALGVAVVAVGAVGAVARPAAANPYEAYIDIDSEEDLYDLLAASQITEDTFTALLDLLNRGVDLNLAGREELYALPNLTYPEVDAIIAFRKEQGFIHDPTELVGAGVLTEDKLLSVAAFLIVTTDDPSAWQPRGWVRATTRWSIKDDELPPLGVRARLNVGTHLTAGLAATVTRLRLGAVRYDPNRDALLADPEGLQFHVPKIYVRYEDEKLVGVLGSYRAGFGQRLVFDNSSDYTPNGFYLDDQLFYDNALTRECKESESDAEAPPTCDLDRRDTYVTPDFHWRETLFGAAGGAKHLDLGPGYVQALAFASLQPKSIYQYELFDPAKCADALGTSVEQADPRRDEFEECGAPKVNRTPDGDVLDPASRYSFQTLPDVFAESLLGGNLTYFADRRNYAGVTAYGAREAGLINGVDLDTQEWSRLPTGRSFGAAGANVAVGRKWIDVFGEFAYSFDKIADGIGPSSGGGGPAVVMRATATGKKKELELSFRYYGIDFVNPYARPIAASDEFEGQRARDEVGGRARYTGKHGPVTVRAAVDFWRNPSEKINKTDVYVRTDVDATDKVRYGLWVEFQDKNLAETGRDECYEVSVEEDERGEPIPCGGMQLTSIGRLRVIPDRALTLTFQLQHQLVDDGSSHYPNKFRHDLSAWAIGLWKPQPRLRIRGRLRYLNEGLSENDYLEQSLWATADASIGLRAKDSLRLRLDYYDYLDKRTATADRSPEPELWLWLEYLAKF
jgi:hypothetical protein